MINFKTIYVIHILITIYLLIKYIEFNKREKKLVENMANSNVDYEAIKSLGVIAKGLTKGGFTVPGNLNVEGSLNATNTISSSNINVNNIKAGFIDNKEIRTTQIKTYKLIPYNGNSNLNYFWLENKDDGAYLLPRANNTCGVGKKGLELDDLYVHGKVAYD